LRNACGAFFARRGGYGCFCLGRPAAVGVAYDGLEDLVDGYVAGNSATTAAVSVSVFTRDAVLLEKAYGDSDIAAGTPNGADTVFEWGSVTKTLTWVSAMQLAEQGKLDLSEDIREYLPKHFLRKLKYREPITMLHLMNHTAGFQEVPLGMTVPFGMGSADLGCALRLIEPAQVFRPGEHMAYSNYGAALAAYIVERISGLPFYEYARANIFTPLGMTKTAFAPGLADNEWVKAQRPKLRCYGTDRKSLGVSMNDYLYPAGMATGTIADLRRLAAALLPDKNGMSPLFQKAGTLTALFTPTAMFPDGETPSDCHGLWPEPLLGGRVIGHLGATVGCTSAIYVDPDAGVGMAVMTNQSGESAYTRKLPRRIFGEQSLGGGDFEEAGDISGVYFMSRDMHEGLLKPIRFMRMVVVVKAEDGYRTFPEHAVAPIGPALYLVADEVSQPLYAVFDEHGRAVKLAAFTEEYMRSDAWYAGVIYWACSLWAGRYSPSSSRS